MYKSLEDYLPDVSIKQIAEKRSIGYDILEKSFDIVKQFIMKKKRIIYGGMSIDMALKAADQEGIYAEDAIPDYDFMSPDAFEDMKELCDLIYKEFGDVGISGINALHPTTMRVRINFVPIADITYIPQATYDRLPTLNWKGFRVIHPTFQRLDMHRALCNPLELVPREVVFFRTRKDIKRFDLLSQAYPLEAPKINTSARTKLVIPIKYLNTGVVGGALAYAFLVGKATVDGDEISVDCANALAPLFKPIILLSEEPTTLRDKILADDPGDVKYYCKFQDDIKPPTLGLSQYDIYDVKGKLTPYKMIQNLRIASHNNVLMTCLERYFNAPKNNKEWLWMYCDLLAHEEVMPTDTYGFYNWSLPYILNAQKQYAQIEGYEIPTARPPPVYNPADDREPPTFDPSKSWLFFMDGSEIEKFKELTLKYEADH